MISTAYQKNNRIEKNVIPLQSPNHIDSRILRLQHQMTITVSLLYILLLQNYLVQVNGHGRLVEPPSRASAWRYISFTFSIKSLNQLEHEYHTPSEHISLIAVDIGISKLLVYFRLFFLADTASTRRRITTTTSSTPAAGPSSIRRITASAESAETRLIYLRYVPVYSFI